jgi:hypothetical protein
MRRSGSLNQCFFCRQHFAGAKAYGRHFDISSGECLPPDAMRAAGLGLTDSGFWAVELQAVPRLSNSLTSPDLEGA